MNDKGHQPHVTNSTSSARIGPAVFAGRSLFAADAWKSIAESLRLSPRELQIVQCVFDDETEESIAQRLSISSHTVHSHMERVYRKLRVTSRVQLVIRTVAEHAHLIGANTSAGVAEHLGVGSSGPVPRIPHPGATA